MDPNVCFSMILDSMADQEWIGAVQHAENLRAWMAKGGAPPGGGRIRTRSIRALLEWLASLPQNDIWPEVSQIRVERRPS